MTCQVREFDMENAILPTLRSRRAMLALTPPSLQFSAPGLPLHMTFQGPQWRFSGANYGGQARDSRVGAAFALELGQGTP